MSQAGRTRYFARSATRARSARRGEESRGEGASRSCGASRQISRSPCLAHKAPVVQAYIGVTLNRGSRPLHSASNMPPSLSLLLREQSLRSEEDTLIQSMCPCGQFPWCHIFLVGREKPSKTWDRGKLIGNRFGF